MRMEKLDLIECYLKVAMKLARKLKPASDTSEKLRDSITEALCDTEELKNELAEEEIG